MKKNLILATLLAGLFLPALAQEKPQTWTLESCIRYALDQNIAIKQSRNSLEQTLVETKSAKAALFPGISTITGQKNLLPASARRAARRVSIRM